MIDIRPISVSTKALKWIPPVNYMVDSQTINVSTRNILVTNITTNNFVASSTYTVTLPYTNFGNYNLKEKDKYVFPPIAQISTNTYLVSSSITNHLSSYTYINSLSTLNFGSYNVFANEVDTFKFPSVIGFKLGPSVRINNCRISIPNLLYTAQFGLSSDTDKVGNWDMIGYFPVSDINVSTQNGLSGIGRSGTNNLGAGWIADMCGFYLKIDPEIIANSHKIIVEYDFYTNTSAGINKHGIGFWDSTSQPTGLNGGPNYRYFGTWEGSKYAYLPDLMTVNTLSATRNFSNNIKYSRTIILENK